MNDFRKRDYIISFLVVLLISLYNIIDTDQSIVGPIVACVVASLFVSFITGTISNFVFRSDKKERKSKT